MNFHPSSELFFPNFNQVGVCHADDLVYLWDPVDINPENGPLPQQVGRLPRLLNNSVGFSTEGDHGHRVQASSFG